MIMDTNKKYLYFNPTTDSVAAAVSVPVSGFVGMETTSSSNLIMYFRESTETDTLDITITRETGSDPKPIMEEIVNAINFAKDSTVVVADNFTEEYLTSKLTEIATLSDGFSFPVKINRPVMAMVDSGSNGFATDPGAGFSTNSYDTNHGTIGQIQGEVITTLFLELNENTIVSSSAPGDVIGKDDAANAFFTQVTTAKNGIVYAGEIICVEVPTTGDADINVTAITNGTVAEDAAGESHANVKGVLANCGPQTLGLRTPFIIPSGGIQGDHLYLTHGGSTAGAYGAGKFIVRLFGAPTSQLNDIA
jgi:hypothetical protein